MIKPALQDEDFLEDVQRAREAPEHLHLWWLGQSGFLVQWGGRHLLFDPYLSDSLTLKYAATDKPHVRMTERVVAPERLNFIDVVSSSHNHTDHLDRETLVPLLRANPKLELVIPEANREFVVNRLEVMAELPRGLNAGESVHLAGFTIHAVPAAHNELEQDQWGRHRYLGYVVEAGSWTIYHAGDTRRYEGMEDWLLRRPIDIALLPIKTLSGLGETARTTVRIASAVRRPGANRQSAPASAYAVSRSMTSSRSVRPTRKHSARAVSTGRSPTSSNAARAAAIRSRANATS